MLRPSDLSHEADFRLGSLRISPSTRRVHREARDVTLEPRMMQALVLLARSPNQVVTRDTLFQEIWGGVPVGDDSLNRAIAGVRKAIDLDSANLRLETIPRTGYVLRTQSSDAAEPPPTETTGVSRRAVVAGAAGVAALGIGGLLVARRFAPDPRFDRLLTDADQVLRYEHPTQQSNAVSLLKQAVAIHPDDGQALGMLAFAYARKADSAVPSEAEGALHEADRWIKAAFAADPQEPFAKLALLTIDSSVTDWGSAEKRLQEILALAPRNTLALSFLVAVLQSAGLTHESWNYNERAIAIDPIAPGHRFRRALKLWIVGQTQRADVVIDRLRELWPNHPFVWNARFLIYAFTGRTQAAQAMIDDPAARPKSMTPGKMAQWRPTLAALADPTPAAIDAARKANLIAARQSPGGAAYAAMALSGIGEVDAAYDVVNGFLLSRGDIVTRQPREERRDLVNNPDWRRTQWMFTPPMAAFRADERFKLLCDRVGLTDYWQKRGTPPDYLRA